MHAWASEVSVRFRELGLESHVKLAPDVETSGAARVVLARRAEMDGTHTTISLCLDPRHVEVAVQLPVASVGVARARLTDPVRALELSTALEALPEQFAIGVARDETHAPASRLNMDDLRALFARAEREQRPLWLGWRVAREVALEHAVLLDEQLQDAAVALGSVLPMLLPGSDAAAPGIVPRRRGGRDRKGSDDERPSREHRASKADRLRERERDREIGPDHRDQDGATGRVRAAGAGLRPGKGMQPRPGRPARGGGQRGIEKGSRVRVLEGPFSGKVGVVQELDGKGGARVMLGLLAVRVNANDLARSAEGRARPVLSTSHRKRVPGRS